MKQVLIKRGRAVVEDVPAPIAEPGMVLVEVDHSCISVGTEMAGIESSGLSLWKRALRHPTAIKSVFELAATQGVMGAMQTVQAKLSTGHPTGYSAAGTVIKSGSGVDDILPGYRVACAGNQYAHHAEYVSVPRNLVVRIPDSLGFPEASTVTLGAIALQGVRRAVPTLGETFVIIGLGVIGQLAGQILKANGCRVIGTDLDKGRIALAKSLGMDVGLHPEGGVDVENVIRLTEGVGADGVIVTAATQSDSVMSTAFQMCRRKGRVVLVGDVGLNLNRADFYQKELDFFISTSYGPGRYDTNYEERGLDYPVAYIRWTENRNMGEFLRLMSQGAVDVKPLISGMYTIEQASAAYEALEHGNPRPMMLLLQYVKIAGTAAQPVTRVANPAARPAGAGKIRIAVVGAGGFAKGMHLPNLQLLSDSYHVRAIVSRTGHNAASTAKQFAADYSSTDYSDVIRDPEVDAVLIATRHNLHANMALAALRANKHVLVEKPLALTDYELSEIQSYYSNAPQRDGVPVILTGFNRRFSPFARRIRELVSERSNPMILNYRMNAGYIPLDHWVHTAEGGGRNRGEACHIYDLFNYLTEARVVRVEAQAICPATKHYSRTDNFVATITFDDGSVATLTYTALGSKDYPKEHLEVYVDGKVMVLEDYKKLTIWGAEAKGVETKLVDKGQKQELVAFAQAIQNGGQWPIPLWQQVQATEIANQVDGLILRY